MKHLRAALPIALTLLLAACGTDTPTPGISEPTTAPNVTAFSANPTTISAAGQAVALSWGVSGTYDSLQLTDSFGQTVSVAGTAYTVYPTQSTSYRLTTTNSAGSDFMDTTVTLQGDTTAPPTPPAPPAPPGNPTPPGNPNPPTPPAPPGEPTPPAPPEEPAPPAPPEEPEPPEEPVPPVPPEEPTPPTTDVPYYGEWIVTYTSDTGVSFIHSLNITEDAPPEGWANGGFGLHTLCLDEVTPCRRSSDEFASGFGYIGNYEYEDGTAPLDLTLFTQYDPEDEPVLKITTFEGLNLETDAEGRQTLEGSAVWALGDGTYDDGTIYAVNIGEPRFLGQSTSVPTRFYADEPQRLKEGLRNLLSAD